MLVDLNMRMIKDTLADSTAVTQQLVSARTPQEFMSRTSALTQPNVEKVLAYGRDVAAITASIQAQLRKAAEAQVSEYKDRVTARTVDLSHNTPDNSGKVLAMMQSAVEKTNSGYEQWAKMTQQAVEAMQANFTTAANQLTAATNKMPVPTSKGNRR
jgi:phasin family protein